MARQQPDRETMGSDDLMEALDNYIGAENPPVFVQTPDGAILRIINVDETPRSRDPLLLTDTIDPEREGL